MMRRTGHGGPDTLLLLMLGRDMLSGHPRSVNPTTYLFPRVHRIGARVRVRAGFCHSISLSWEKSYRCRQCDFLLFSDWGILSSLCSILLRGIFRLSPTGNIRLRASWSSDTDSSILRQPRNHKTDDDRAKTTDLQQREGGTAVQRIC